MMAYVCRSSEVCMYVCMYVCIGIGMKKRSDREGRETAMNRRKWKIKKKKKITNLSGEY